MIGIGVDVVEIERFRQSLARTPTMRERLFTQVELDYVAPQIDPVPSLAVRFAAREATMKALGLGLGGIAALSLTRFMQGFLVGVPATDPITFVSVGMVLLVVAVSAAWLPAWRAASVDPLEALGSE